MEPIRVDPSDYARYATIEDICHGAYNKQKVRIMGTLVRNNKQAKKIVLSHNNSQIECSLPDDFNENLEDSQYYQAVGIVHHFSQMPVFECNLIRALSCCDESNYDFAVSKFNEYVFQ